MHAIHSDYECQRMLAEVASDYSKLNISPLKESQESRIRSSQETRRAVICLVTLRRNASRRDASRRDACKETFATRGAHEEILGKNLQFQPEALILGFWRKLMNYGA